MQIAVDTNVLMHRAAELPDVMELLEIIRERTPNAVWLVTPTVLQELLYIAKTDPQNGHLAHTALISMLGWGFNPVNVIPVGHGIVEEDALKMRLKGIVPEDEVNDSYILMEAALLGCSILLSGDGHMHDANGP